VRGEEQRNILESMVPKKKGPSNQGEVDRELNLKSGNVPKGFEGKGKSIKSSAAIKKDGKSLI